jgi:5-methyltetrahydrofolate--homocysteine methyltransferase
VIVDPLIMPVGAINLAGRTALDLITRLRTELKVNTTCGASNISFGLPNRHGMNAAFLSMAAGAGMTSAIMNPLHPEEMTGIMGANVMNGVDPECRKWIKKFREPAAEGAAGGRERRSNRRRARD